MNYPIWQVPAPGLVIAAIAVLHVFISHFAVGGGLLLVWLERRAYRTGDAALLEYARRHSRFFVLLTLVLGALTGVGIWLTIALVHPQATSTLIQAFVWGWAIEWTFFVTEIAAALIYVYGWDRLDRRTHLAIGWIYFIAAWLSLAVINGILSFMLTPGRWVVTQNFWDGVLNPTYLPTLVARTAGALGLAGAYGLLTLAWSRDVRLRQRLARPLALRWVVPGVITLMASLVWVAHAAGVAGISVASTLGAPPRLVDVLRSLFGPATTGHPIARLAARVALDGMVVTAAIAALVGLTRGRLLSRTSAVLLMAGALAVVGGLEWLREDLRKPYVIGNYMLLSGVRVSGAPPFTADDLLEHGALQAAKWVTLPDRAVPDIARQDAMGRELFRLQCSPCHTARGYLGIEPLVRGASRGTLEGVIARLPGWRGRRMPPFTGTEGERDALAVHLALVGGATAESVASREGGAGGAQLFEDDCAMCHGADADFPFQARGRAAATFYDLLGRLPQVNDAMPAFEGSDEDRRALAAHLATLEFPRTGGGR